MGQYCSACERLSSVVVCNTANGQVGRLPGAWPVGRLSGRAPGLSSSEMLFVTVKRRVT